MIKHIGDKWILFTKDGSKRLGSHSSEADAKAQEAAIEISKHRGAEDGEEVFESLHLLGATGHSRYEMWDGKRYLVVPTVALMEGVIHAVNASSPEYVPKALLETNPEAWDGHPILLGHAVRGGKQCSAHDEAILNAQQFGTIRKTHAKDGKLGMESWVDPVRLKELGREDVLKRLEKNEPISVSVGAFVSANGKVSEFNGKRYEGEWLSYHPDHLAYLPDGKGACSLEMGCGTHRAAMHLVTAEGLEEFDEEDLEILGGPGSGWTAEGGHVPGSQGGTAKQAKEAALAHESAAAVHEAAAAGRVSSSTAERATSKASSATKKAGYRLSGSSDPRTEEKLRARSEQEKNVVDWTNHAIARASNWALRGEDKKAAYHKSAAEGHRKAAAALKGTVQKFPNDSWKSLGGPGSGWSAEGGHVGGSQGGHSAAAKAHRDAAGAHLAAAAGITHAGKDVPAGTQELRVKLAGQATKTALAQTKVTGTKPYAAEAAKAYSQMSQKGDSAKFHSEAARYHTSAAKWHEKVGKMKNMEAKPSLTKRLLSLFEKALGSEEAVKALALYDTPEQAASEEAAELISYNTMRSLCDQVGSSYEELSSLIDDLISDEEENPTETTSQEEAEEEVECARLEAVQTLVASMNSTLWQVQALAAKLLTPDLPEPASPRYNEELRTALSKTVDEKTLSVIFDQRLVELEDGEEKDTELEIRAAECRCEEKNMTRAERIAALLKSEHNPLKDQKSLEASSDEGLKLLEVHVTNAASLKAAADKQAADKKAEEEAEKLKAAAAANTQLSEEDYLKTAPDSIRTLVADSKARTAIRTAELVTELKTAQNAYTEDELKKLPLETLEKLAKVAGLDAPVSADFTLARPRAAQENDVYANPPDGYALAVAKKNGTKEAVN